MSDRPCRRVAVVVALLATLGAWTVAQQATGVGDETPAPRPGNILVLLADDLGVDMLGVYGEGSDLPPTPNLDALARGGVLFRNAWASPVCSPSRAVLQTGRHAFRSGVGFGIPYHRAYSLPLDEVTLAELLRGDSRQTWSTAAFGKWHLASVHPDDDQGGRLAPNRQGYQHYAGVLGGAPRDYFAWASTVNGRGGVVREYATTHHVDNALAWIDRAREPWLVYLAFNAPHAPFHAPPPELHTQDLSAAAAPGVDPRPYYKAQVEALDTEIGRLLRGLGDARQRTHVLFMGDNGTPGPVLMPPFSADRGKSTLYESGVRVPFLVSGPAVVAPGRESAALTGLVDVFATVAELAGVDPLAVLPPGRALDSRSLVPVLSAADAAAPREVLMTETFSPMGREGGRVGRDGDAEPVYQLDAGHGGPGSARLEVCGEALYVGNRAEVRLSGAPAGAVVTLRVAPVAAPDDEPGGAQVRGALPMPGLVDLDPIRPATQARADEHGELRVALDIMALYLLLAYEPRAHGLAMQAVVDDPRQESGRDLSNIVRLELPGWNVKAIRDARYKLIHVATGGADEFYDLLDDPLEQRDLMGRLTPAQQRAHDRLLAEVTRELDVARPGPAELRR